MFTCWNVHPPFPPRAHRCNEWQRYLSLGSTVGPKANLENNLAIVAQANLAPLWAHPKVCASNELYHLKMSFIARSLTPFAPRLLYFCLQQWAIGETWTLRTLVTSTCNIDLNVQFSTNGGMLKFTVAANANSQVRWSFAGVPARSRCHALAGAPLCSCIMPSVFPVCLAENRSGRGHWCKLC